jgi:hypothetical protein
VPRAASIGAWRQTEINMNTFKQVSDARYDEMLGVVPPALWISHGFLVGEPENHRTCTINKRICSTFAAFVQHDGKYFESLEAMTVAEFRAVDPHTMTVQP